MLIWDVPQRKILMPEETKLFHEKNLIPMECMPIEDRSYVDCIRSVPGMKTDFSDFAPELKEQLIEEWGLVLTEFPKKKI